MAVLTNVLYWLGVETGVETGVGAEVTAGAEKTHKSIILYAKNIWPVSREKRPSDITHSVDQYQPLYHVKTHISNQIVYTARNICAIDVMSVKKCRP